MNEKEFKRLINAYLEGTATPHEIRIVERFFDSYRAKPAEWPNEIIGDKVSSKDRIFKLIESNKEENFGRGYNFGRRNWIKRSLQIAATILLFLIGGYTIYTYQFKDRVESVSDIIPGSKKAILTLADNSQIILDSMQTGSIAKQDQISVIKLNDGQIAYSGELSQSSQSSSEIERASKINTLSIPRGGEYQITLSDGTKVWLNSESTLSFPINFTEKERRVEVTGECYFEVAKNLNKPFIVNVNNKIDIEVLGTEFNVTAYKDDGDIKTTLIEGSVRINQYLRNSISKSINLSPGQQANIDKEGVITTLSVDVREFTLWKEGWFYFNDQSLSSILKKLSRWYDFSYTIDPKIDNQRFSMKIKRFDNFNTVEEILGKTGKVRFEREGNLVNVKSI